MSDFAEYNPTAIFIYSAFALIEKRLGKAAASQKSSISVAFQDYLRHPESYDHILINGGTYNDFCRIMDHLKTTPPKQISSTTASTPLSLRGMWSAFVRLHLRDAVVIWGIIVSILGFAFALGSWLERIQRTHISNQVNSAQPATLRIPSTQNSP
jgi:hypothetical protein